MKYLPLFIFSVAVIVASCGKGDSPGNNNVAPTNLTVNGNIYTNQLYGKTSSTLNIYLEWGIGKVNLY